MAVISATANQLGALVNSPQAQPAAPKQGRKQEDQQESAVVKISKQAQQLSRADEQNNNTARAVTKPKEAAEPTGIRLMEGKSKGGHVNTFA
jgi:hypothetical protein